MLVNARKQCFVALHGFWAKFLERPRWFRYLLAFCLLVVLIGFVVDVKNTRDYPGADLRPRVVGYRLLITGRDPYRFLWTPGMSSRLVDPYLPPGLDLTRTAATPTTLLIDAPLEPFSYQVQRYIWLLAQWALLLGMIFWQCGGSPAKIAGCS